MYCQSPAIIAMSAAFCIKSADQDDTNEA